MRGQQVPALGTRMRRSTDDRISEPHSCQGWQQLTSGANCGCMRLRCPRAAVWCALVAALPASLQADMHLASPPLLAGVLCSRVSHHSNSSLLAPRLRHAGPVHLQTCGHLQVHLQQPGVLLMPPAAQGPAALPGYGRERKTSPGPLKPQLEPAAAATTPAAPPPLWLLGWASCPWVRQMQPAAAWGPCGPTAGAGTRGTAAAALLFAPIGPALMCPPPAVARADPHGREPATLLLQPGKPERWQACWHAPRYSVQTSVLL